MYCCFLTHLTNEVEVYNNRHLYAIPNRNLARFAHRTETLRLDPPWITSVTLLGCLGRPTDALYFLRTNSLELINLNLEV